jgi:hypothetical protein
MCNHVNSAKHMADMGRLGQVACYFPSFADVRAEGQDVTSWS